MIALDGATALRLLREVVAERPDYVYKAPQHDGSGTCLYVAAGHLCCLIAHVLARAGYPIEVIHKLDSWGSIEFAVQHVPEIVMDAAAEQILAAAQKEQDHRATWAVALAAAELRAWQLGVAA